MIARFLIDFEDAGDYFLVSIETNDKASLIDELKGYSRDVLYVDSKDDISDKDTGKRRLKHGIIRRCAWWGSKSGFRMRFETSQWRMDTLKKAVKC